MSILAFEKIIESETTNFGITKENFGDIVSWGEMLKDILEIKIIKEKPGPIEYYQLFHLLGNSYINAFLLITKGYIFHSYAISRIGFESFFQMAIIESDYATNIDAWRNYMYERPDSDCWKAKWKIFNKIFVKDRSKHDYSQFINNDAKKTLIDRWNHLSAHGSHVSLIQTLFSFDIKKIGENDIVYSGLFDINENNAIEIGKSLIWLIDSFFILTVSTSKIFENHNVYLYKDHSEIKNLWGDWMQSKLAILSELGISSPKSKDKSKTP